ncbi:MAG TPA: hypothetical protein VFQ76_06465 [Longimicrobiaceae bacterium]|nr:hypothetical protein [Longimicrobiaceae bacterium]
MARAVKRTAEQAVEADEQVKRARAALAPVQEARTAVEAALEAARERVAQLEQAITEVESAGDMAADPVALHSDLGEAQQRVEDEEARLRPIVSAAEQGERVLYGHRLRAVEAHMLTVCADAGEGEKEISAALDKMEQAAARIDAAENDHSDARSLRSMLGAPRQVFDVGSLSRLDREQIRTFIQRMRFRLSCTATGRGLPPTL